MILIIKVPEESKQHEKGERLKDTGRMTLYLYTNVKQDAHKH